MPIVETQWTTLVEQQVTVEAGDVRLKADLVVPEDSFGLVLFATGDGLSRVSSRSRRITRELEELGLATLALDLQTAQEERGRLGHGAQALNASRLAARLSAAVAWAKQQPELREFPVGILGAGIGAVAALNAAASQRGLADAVVCWSGKADLGKSALENVHAPTLLLTGDGDAAQVQANESALFRLAAARKELILIPEASTRSADFAELDVVADLGADWFSRYLILVHSR